MTNVRFSNQNLIRLLIPLFLEQILNFLVGFADTLMVSGAGEAAVSAVSLTDSINVLIIFLLSALASGGAIVYAQSIGRRDYTYAQKSIGQLLMIVLSISMIICVLCLLLRDPILRLLYGSVEAKVMTDCRVYLRITALSYPFIGLFNGFCALYRAGGDSATGLYASVVMNLINVIGNAICVYGLKMGVAGVAYPTLISRMAAALIMLLLSLRPGSLIRMERQWKYYRFDPKIALSILKIGIPTGIENSLFQFAKLCLTSLVATLGTSATAAWAVSNNISLLEYIPSSAIGIAMVTVVGQCFGAEEYAQVKYYVRKLIKLTYLLLLLLVLPLTIFAKPIIGLFNISAQAQHITWILVLMSSVAIFMHPPAFPLSHALRSVSDVTYTMAVAIFSVWLFRFCLSYLLVRYTALSIYGVWLAMFADWLFRAALFIPRMRHFYKRWGV